MRSDCPVCNGRSAAGLEKTAPLPRPAHVLKNVSWLLAAGYLAAAAAAAAAAATAIAVAALGATFVAALAAASAAAALS